MHQPDGAFVYAVPQYDNVGGFGVAVGVMTFLLPTPQPFETHIGPNLCILDDIFPYV